MSKAHAPSVSVTDLSGLRSQITPATRAVLGDTQVYAVYAYPGIVKVAYTHLQQMGARAYAHLYYCGMKVIYTSIFLAIHHCLP